MSWIEHHESSERLASQAEMAVRENRQDEALALYARAADAEERAIADLDRSKTRTFGISAVSAAALYYKAHQLARAEQAAIRWLGFDRLPVFARDQLRLLLQSIWSEQVRERAGSRFAPGQVLISVQGGEVVPGGAPLDLIADKVRIVQSIFYRTAEFLSGIAHRRHGAPSRDVQESCRPWLFQTAPGSYQFAVAIQERYQPNLFEPKLRPPREVADCFLRILQVGIEDPEERIAEVVPQPDYRRTFLKLTRNLAPDGKTCDRLEIRSPAESSPLSLDADVRRNLGRIIRKERQERVTPAARSEHLRGVLRAIHLDKDWLELTDGSELHHVYSVGEEVDDVVGPLVNRPVIVHTSVVDGKNRFLDIELDSAPPAASTGPRRLEDTENARD